MDARVYSIDDVRVEALDAVPLAISVSVAGQVNSTGWTNPRLAPWTYAEPPKDGIIDCDFIANAPTGFVIFVFSPIGLVCSLPVPDWVKGVRIHASSNKLDAILKHTSKAAETSITMNDGSMRPSGEGIPGPWPFPWMSPNKKS